MSKEYLEALESSVVLKFVVDLLKRYEGKTDYNIYITKDWLLEIKQALQRLESIDNAKPSDALECLERLNYHTTLEYQDSKEYYIARQYIHKAQENEKENTRNEEILQKYYQEGNTLDSVRALKQERDNYKRVLDIIKETENVKVSFYENGSGKHYKLEFDRTRNQTITEEEFDLLKRWLG